ncbi:MAG: DUF2459 domain-containing protein [Gammaproteobacteria bacterium]
MAALKTSSLLVIVIALCCACTAPVKKNVDLLRADRPATSLYLVVDSWHAGVVIKRADIPGELLPERRDFPEAEYLEFAWGDWDFYQAPKFNLGYALKALFFPTKSVLHVVGFRGPVVRYAPYRELIELHLSTRRLERLVGYIDETFARGGTGAVAPLGPGLYGDSRFYPARGKFHLFNTCNTWAAGALQAAGYPISPAITVDALVSQVRAFGAPLHSRPAGR